MFAIVDIETTGGYAGANNITEIAIVLHDGKEIQGKYSTLVNPLMPIQKYVQGLTGITDAMVATAPTFSEVAPAIYNLLSDKIFVAHNVNFDYSFVKSELQKAGFNLHTHKLCTIRLSKKAFPNLPKYGLGTVCRELNITVENRHRAAGDAMATAILFDKILQSNKRQEVDNLIKKKLHSYLPPNVNEADIENLPRTAGVYYFKNKQQKIIYIGKAKNIYKRVTSHFSNNKTTAQKAGFLQHVYSIAYTLCSSEFTAAVLESIEIKKYWPLYNKSQKYYEPQYGIYSFEDNKGYKRLGIDAYKKTIEPLLSFSTVTQAQNTLKQWIREYQLHPVLCYLAKQLNNTNLPTKEEHETVMQQIEAAITTTKKSFLIQEKSNFAVLVKNGVFYGMGEVLLSANAQQYPLENVTQLVTQYPSNQVIQSLIQKHISQYPNRVIWLQ